MIKKRFSQFVPPVLQEAFHSHCQQVIESGTRQICEIELNGKNGKYFCAQLQSVPVGGRGGNPLRLQIAVLDITERKRIEADLIAAQ